MIHQTAQTFISWSLSVDVDLNYHLFFMWEHKLCGQKYKDFELMLIQVVLSYRIVFPSAASLKGKHYVYKYVLKCLPKFWWYL